VAKPPARLSHAQALQDLPGGKAGLEGHLAVVLSRRQDRRGRPERCRQVEPCSGSWPAKSRNFLGEAWAGRRRFVSVTCRQEPELDGSKGRARQRHAGAWRTRKALVDRYNEIAANYSDDTAEEMAKLQDEIEAQGLWGPRHAGGAGARRLALPAW